MAKRNLKDRLRELFGSTTRDARALDEILEEVGEEDEAGASPVHVHNYVPDNRRNDDRRDNEDPGEIEIHNHIPEADGEREEMGMDRRDRRDEEMPPWFAEYAANTDARFKSITDRLDRRDGPLTEWAEEEEDEPGHEGLDRRRSDDRRDRRGRDETEEEKREKAEDEKILGELEFEAPLGTGDKARKARDSQFLSDSFQTAVSNAEILQPGIRLPSFDEKASPKQTLRTIDKLRRTTLDLAYGQAETRGMIDAALGSRALDTKTMSIGDTRTLFNAVAGVRGMMNTGSARDGTSLSQNSAGLAVKGQIKTPADLNKFNREKYRRKVA